MLIIFFNLPEIHFKSSRPTYGHPLAVRHNYCTVQIYNVSDKDTSLLPLLNNYLKLLTIVS